MIELNWKGGNLNLPVEFTDNAIAETVFLLQGARLITDWESRYPAAEALAPLEKRKESRVAARLLSLSETYGLASREMSLVAVVIRAGDRPGELPETRVVPVGMPQDTAFGSYFNKRLLLPSEITMDFCLQPIAVPASDQALAMHAAHPSTAPVALTPDLFSQFFGSKKPRAAAPAQQTPEDFLLTLAGRLESDGGLPGSNPASRASATIIALLAFLSQGHTISKGVFRSHVAKLVAFLKSLTGLSPDHQKLLTMAVTLNAAPPGDWLTLAASSGDHWKEIARALKP